MAHGITLKMRAIKPAVEWIMQHPPMQKAASGSGFVKAPGMETHVNPAKDRSLNGKARRVARKAARR